jgi:hypothetical protein
MAIRRGCVLKTPMMGLKLEGNSKLGAMVAAQYLRNVIFNRGMPKPRPQFLLFKSQEYDDLDAQNRAHVERCLRDYAASHRCSVNDLGWSLGSQQLGNGLYPVSIDLWENIDRRAFEERKCGQ